jgi:hypothetical protein
MTKKGRRESLRDSLSEVVRPPEPNPKLDAILGRYAADSPVLQGLSNQPREPVASLDPPQTTLRPPKARLIAPARDFNKRANILDRDALPSGLFPGSSKKLYDALYIRTLGAVVPTKTIQATRRELSKWSGIKNIKTIAAHLRHLETVGLVVRTWDRGDNEGSVYEVCLPDGLRPPKTTQGGVDPPEVASGPNSVLPLDRNSASGGLSQPVDSQATSDDGKTSFKTKEINTDDEALAGLNATLKKATKDITGREISPTETTRWTELAEVLVTELKIAAGRTTVSSVPAFLAEHLRRRLWKKEKRQIEEEGKSGANSPEPEVRIDASKCPDCFGTGMWYPEGYEKGVARCGHDKLKAFEPTTGE